MGQKWAVFDVYRVKEEGAWRRKLEETLPLEETPSTSVHTATFPTSRVLSVSSFKVSFYVTVSTEYHTRLKENDAIADKTYLSFCQRRSERVVAYLVVLSQPNERIWAPKIRHKLCVENLLYNYP